MIYNSLILGPASGSVGGLVLSHNKGGPYIRARRVPTNPDSSRQTTTRAYLSQFATKWTTLLNATQRDQWNTYAQNHTITNSLGLEIHITGLAWYVKCNSVLLDAALSTILVPPTLTAPNALTTMSVVITSAIVITVTFTPALNSTTCLQAWMTLPQTLGATPNFRQARLTGYSNKNEASPWLGVPAFVVPTGKSATFFVKVMSQEGLLSASKSYTATASY